MSAAEHRQRLLQAAGEAGQCFVGFAVAALVLNVFAGIAVFTFGLLAVGAPLLVIYKAACGGAWRGSRQDDDSAKQQTESGIPPGEQAGQGGANDDSDATKV